MAADKLDTDLRQPAFSFDLAFLLGGPQKQDNNEGVGVLTFGVVLPNPLFWIQLVAFMALEVVLGCIAAVINYNLIVCRRNLHNSVESKGYVRSVEPYLVGLVTISLCVIFPYLIISAFNVRNMIIKFCLATIMPVLTIFHTMEAVFATSPACVESTMGRYVWYSASPLEVCFDPVTCQPIKAKLTLEAVRDFAVFLMILGIYQSVFGPCAYEPFDTQVPLDSMDHTIRDLLSFAHLFNNLVAAILLQLYLTTFCLGLKVVTNLLVGVETKRVMSNAIFDSSSPSDFWGRKWNTLIHGVLKRATFKPAVRHFPKSIAAMAAFLASGLFHEWILSAIFYVHDYERDERGQCQQCYQPSYGRNLLFFSINAIIMATEYFVGKWCVFRWISRTLPKPLVSILVVCTALPFAHLFTADYIKSDYFYHGQIGFPLLIQLS